MSARLHLVLFLAALVVLTGGVQAGPAHAQEQPSGTAAEAVQAGPSPAFAPPPPERALRGVVWHPSADTEQAVRTLRRMKAAGVEAVRTPLIRRERLLETADTLRLRFFQDLPAGYLSAGEVTEALPELRWELERALLMARRHPSARHFGLLSRSDTSVPRTCEALRELAARVRTYGPADAIPYYETPFVERDRCKGAAPLTLLNALNEEDPQALLRRWRQARSEAPSDAAPTEAQTTGEEAAKRAPASTEAVSVGLGALGTWVHPGAEGLRAPHSPEAQARYFERHLPLLLRDSVRTQAVGRALPERTVRSERVPRPAVVFVFRWRDVSARSAQAGDTQRGPSPIFVHEDPYGRHYGLHAANGDPRPALRVVRGLYTGRQQVFAFQAGEAPRGPLPWLVLVGWGLAVGMGVFYASASRFRGMVQRYFGSPSFYRNALREGREALASGSFVLLAAVGLCAGLIVTVFLLAVQETGPFVQLLRGTSVQAQEGIQALLQRPWLAVLAVALFYVVSLGTWAFLLSQVTRRSYPLGTTQVLVLVTAPRWPAFLLAMAAVVTTTLPGGWMLPVSTALVALWGLVSVVAIARALYDLALLADLTPVLVPVLPLLNPALLALVMIFFAVLEFWQETTFLWHLATRS